MITVSIFVNGTPVFTRSAVNKRNARRSKKYLYGGWCEYLLDDGTKLIHRREDGVLALAKRMLETIKEP